jgi:hypothetical protein
MEANRRDDGLFVIGVVVAAASVSQFLPFLAECAPVPGGDCRIGF